MAANAAMTVTQKIISIAVVILIVATVAIPIIEENSPLVSVSANNYSQVFTSTSSQDVNLKYNTSTHILTVNDNETFDLNSIGHTIVLAFTDTLFVQYHSSSKTMRVYGDTDLTPTNTTEVSFSSGTVTWTTSGGTNTQSYSSSVYHISKTGNYAIFERLIDADLYFNKDTEMWMFTANLTANNTDLDPTSITMRAVILHGTYDNCNSTLATIGTSSASSFDSALVSVDLTDLVEDNGDYLVWEDIDKVNFVVDAGEGDYSKLEEVTVVAPIQYTKDDIMPLFSVVILMLILVPLMMAVRMIALKRN